MWVRCPLVDRIIICHSFKASCLLMIKGGMTMDDSLLEKTKKVIDSCKNTDQLKAAETYVELVKPFDDETFKQSKELLDKKKEKDNA